MTREQARKKYEQLLWESTGYPLGRERAKVVIAAGELEKWRDMDLSVISEGYERGFWDYVHAWEMLNK